MKGKALGWTHGPWLVITRRCGDIAPTVRQAQQALQPHFLVRQVMQSAGFLDNEGKPVDVSCRKTEQLLRRSTTPNPDNFLLLHLSWACHWISSIQVQTPFEATWYAGKGYWKILLSLATAKVVSFPYRLVQNSFLYLDWEDLGYGNNPSRTKETRRHFQGRCSSAKALCYRAGQEWSWMTGSSWQTLDTVYQSSYLESMWVHWGPQISATFLRYAFCKSLLQELAQADAVERHRAREKESTLELVRNCQWIQLFLVLPSRNGRGKRWLSLQNAMKCNSNGFTQLGSRVQHWLANRSESCWLFRVHLTYSITGWATKQLSLTYSKIKVMLIKREKTIGPMKTCGSSMLKLCLHEVQAIREGRRKRREVQAGVERCPKMWGLEHETLNNFARKPVVDSQVLYIGNLDRTSEACSHFFHTP